MRSKTGAMMADEPARIAIRPIATATFPLAIAVKAGPYGALGIPLESEILQ